MDKEKIHIEYSITKDEIDIRSSSTIFISLKRIKTININQLTNDINEIKRICKERKIIISRKGGVYKFFKDNKNKYLEEVKKVHSLFDKLSQGWQEKVEKGIYTGYTDDEELKRLEDLEYEIIKITQGEIISNISALYHTVETLKYELKDTNTEFERITL